MEDKAICLDTTDWKILLTLSKKWVKKRARPANTKG